MYVIVVLHPVSGVVGTVFGPFDAAESRFALDRLRSGRLLDGMTLHIRPVEPLPPKEDTP